MVKAKKTSGFENSLEELTLIVEQMEKGDLSLEDSLLKFEQGVNLARNCQAILKTAEQKVQILTEKNGAAVLTDFNENNNDTNEE